MFNFRFLVLGVLLVVVLVIPVNDVFAEYTFVKSFGDGPHSISCAGVPSGT